MRSHLRKINEITINLQSKKLITSSFMQSKEAQVNSVNKICGEEGPITNHGKCINYSLNDVSQFIPEDFQKTWNVLTPAIEYILGGQGIQACKGEYLGSEIKDNSLATPICNSIPVVDDNKFKIIAMSVPVPCPTTAATVKMCVTWSKCGTYAISFNGQLLGCILALGGSSTGVLAAAGEVSSSLNEFSIGFSLKKQFQQSAKVAYLKGDDIVSSKITIHGHVFLNIGIQLPKEFFSFGSTDLDDYINLNANIKLLINFGEAAEIVEQSINDLKSLTPNKAKQVINNIISSRGGEFVIDVNGQISISLSQLSSGLIPDFSFSLGNASLFASKGKGESGLDAGFYIRVDSNAAADLINSIKGFFKAYGDILKIIGFDLDDIPVFGLELSLTLNEKVLGFDFRIGDLKIKCIFKMDKKNLSCSLGSNFFNAILEGGKAIFKTAVKFFDDTGKLIAEKSKEAFQIATKTISESVGKSVGFIADTSGNLVKLGSDKFNEMKKESEQKMNEFNYKLKDAFNALGNKAKEYAAEVEKKAKDMEEALERTVRETAEKAERERTEFVKKSEAVAKKTLRDAGCLFKLGDDRQNC